MEITLVFRSLFYDKVDKILQLIDALIVWETPLASRNIK